MNASPTFTLLPRLKGAGGRLRWLRPGRCLKGTEYSPHKPEDSSLVRKTHKEMRGESWLHRFVHMYTQWHTHTLHHKYRYSKNEIKQISIFNLIVRISVKPNNKLSGLPGGLYGLSQSWHAKFKNRLLEDDSSVFFFFAGGSLSQIVGNDLKKDVRLHITNTQTHTTQITHTNNLYLPG